MPRIVIGTSQELFDSLEDPEGTGSIRRREIMWQLREIAAKQLAAAGMTMITEDGEFPLTHEGVSARWLPFPDSQNEASIEIDLVYSSSEESFFATKEQRLAIGQAIAERVQTLVEFGDFDYLAPLYCGIWVQPISGGTYVAFEYTPKEG